MPPSVSQIHRAGRVVRTIGQGNSKTGRHVGRSRVAVTAGMTPVWDAFIRWFHWLLVVGIGIALTTGFQPDARMITLHLATGAAVVALVTSRIIWGFAGGRFARFSGFLPGPATLRQHLRDLSGARVADGSSHRHLGHNPLGAVMILALLGVIAGLALTGLMIWGGVFWHGPFAAYVSYAMGGTAGKLHKWLAIGLVALIGLHVAGALFESIRSRENLIFAMISGRKVRRPGDILPRPASARPRVAVLTAVAVTCAILLAGQWSPRAGRPGPPVTIDGTAYAATCGDCHAAFHPSLLPAASWSSVMAGLEDHFGEDATLDAVQAADIAGYLMAHAAETTDSKPAHVFRAVSTSDPLRITATPFWTRTHAGLPDRVFAAPSVGSRADCAACHADAATGWFYPGSISIPPLSKGTTP